MNDYDKGPWEAKRRISDGKWCVQSDDFTHDVQLIIYGNFDDASEQEAYAHALARQLNARTSYRTSAGGLTSTTSTKIAPDAASPMVPGKSVTLHIGAVTDSRCNYLTEAGRSCNKCRRVHDGGGAPWPGIIDTDGVPHSCIDQQDGTQ